MKMIIAIVAALLAIVGNVTYLMDINKKKVKPHPYTWLVWSIVPCIAFFGQLASGAGIAVLSTGVAEIFTIIIFLISLKYGFKSKRRIDTYCFIVALADSDLPVFERRPPPPSAVSEKGLTALFCCFFPAVCPGRELPRHRGGSWPVKSARY
jgi:hypothetical protein